VTQPIAEKERNERQDSQAAGNGDRLSVTLTAVGMTDAAANGSLYKTDNGGNDQYTELSKHHFSRSWVKTRVLGLRL